MNRRLPLLLVAGVLALCLVGVVVVGVTAGSGFGAVAYTVDGTKVSQQSVNDDLATLADHDTFATQTVAATFRATPGAVTSAGAADWLTIEIYRQLGTRRLAAKGVRITAANRKAAVAAVVAQSGPAFATQLRALPTDLQDRLADVLVLQSALPSSGLKGADVTVDPKYGFWNAKQGRVCPPTGCPAASASASSGTGG
jgi:hypothetical protein